MSEPPLVRRYPLRSGRGPPRHPDSPVSFAIPQARGTVDDTSNSDDESAESVHDDFIEDLEAGIAAEALQHVSNAAESMAPEPIVVHSRSPTPDVLTLQASSMTLNVASMLQQLQESLHREEQELHDASMDSDDDSVLLNEPSIMSVDSGEGTLQERADCLVQHILRLQPGGPTPPSRQGSPTPTEILTPPRASHRVPVSTTLLAAQGSGMITVTGLQGGPLPALYFVGIQTQMSARSFCQLRSFLDADANDGAIFRRLQLAGGPVGRALSTIIDRRHFYVGTSDQPIDIGSLFEVELHDGANVQFLPIPESPARSALIQSQRVDENMNVYVLYVYHEDADSLLLATAPANSLGTSHTVIALPAPSVSALPSVSTNNAGLNQVAAYLQARFAPEYSQLAAWRSSSYGSAYNHCLIERQIMHIYQLLGIGLLGRHHAPAVVGNMSIRMEDVVVAAGINPQTFSTYRTELRLIKDAHIVLRRLHRTGELPLAQKPLLDCLEVMLSERTLSADAMRPLPGSQPSAEAEFSAVRMTISALMFQVRQVIDNFGNA
ncbi:hypothetical protein C8R45DRAFT_1112770 [Mycena sanguinolenta]|nr:hypothetical protein C8R45DRAFT_1112770 [Mycena sanguinolenta]